MTAEAHSLVEWVNSFGEGECDSLKDLSSGALLFRCMGNVLPDLTAETGQEWGGLLRVLTEFCGCSLDQSLRRELMEAGDEEHLARAVVLLLCLAVQRKPNEDIIAKITTLQYQAQRDIMYFIEETLAKINSNALSSGLFTSGVGDVVPQLSGRRSPELVEEVCKAMEEGEEEQETNDGGGAELVSTPQPTPNRLSKPPSCSNLFMCLSSVPRLTSRSRTNQASSYYRGLESPAALQWMKQPKPRGEGVGGGSTGLSEDQPEEVLRLKHKVRVLERSLANEQNLSQEMHTALCQKDREIQELEDGLRKAQEMGEKARELADVQDELQTVAEALERSEKNVQRLQRESEEQRLSQVKELEKKVADIDRLMTENSQLKELLEKTVAEQLEQESDVKRLQLSAERGAIAFQAKQRECDSLLQLNREYSTDVRELKQRYTSLQKELSDLRDTSVEREKTLGDENHTLSLKLSQAQEQLEKLQEEYRRLERECESVRRQVAVVEAGSSSMLDQYQATVGELERLKTQFKMTQAELEEAGEQRELLLTQLREKDEELGRLRQQLSEVEKTSQEKLEEAKQEGKSLQMQLAEKESELGALQEQLCELQKTSQEKLEKARELEGCLQSQLREKEEELGGLRGRLEVSEEQLTVKENDLNSLSQTTAEQKQQIEEQLAEAHQKLNSLIERYTTEAEEMAAVKASLEEDLSRAHSELRGTRWELAEREKARGEMEREVGATRNQLEGLKRELGSEVEGLRQEKSRVEEEKGKMEGKMQEMVAWVEVKEARWKAERTALENRTIELSCQVESLKNTTRSLQAREEERERERGQEREGWATQLAMLEQQVADLTEELDSATARSREWEREVGDLKSAVEKAQSLADSLQAEVPSKTVAVTALEEMVGKAREECRRQREEGEEREQSQLAGLEATRKELAEVTEERDSARAELEHLEMDSKHSLTRLEAEYQNAVIEKEQTHEAYSSELRALEETNAALQQQQNKASAENAIILEKQSELYREMTQLQETKAEAMELCRRYEGLYNEERERRQTDRELIRKMRSQEMSENKTAVVETDSLRRQLSDERRTTTRLGAENRSLKAQVSYLEKKLQDSERVHTQNTFSANQQTSRPYSHTNTLTSQPQYSTTFSKKELDTSTNHTVFSAHQLTSRDPAAAETTFNDSILSGPTFQSTAVKKPPPTPNYSTQLNLSQTSRAGEGGGGGGGEDDAHRISELRSRNKKVLPHLKSSYAVELQEKTEDPCLLGVQTRRSLRTRRAVGNTTSLRLTSDSISLPDESRKRTSGSRKLTGDLSSPSGSPASSRRRISDPATPRPSLSTSLQPPGQGDSVVYDLRRDPLEHNYHPRGCQRDENCLKVDESEDLQGSMFEMNFSPPARAGKRPPDMPERLRQRLNTTRSKQEKPVSVAPPASTGIDRKRTGKITKPQAGRRGALRAKN